MVKLLIMVHRTLIPERCHDQFSIFKAFVR